MEDPDVYTIYILRCSDRSLYTGITNDMKSRMRAHRDGTGSKYVRAKLPFKVVYTEVADGRSAASRREYEIKQLTKDAKEQLIQEYLQDSYES